MTKQRPKAKSHPAESTNRPTSLGKKTAGALPSRVARATAASNRSSRLTNAIIETADDMRHAGVLDETAHAKITRRHLGKPAGTTRPISGDEIRKVREQARLSQAVFAQCLNVTTGYVSQLERGTKQPTGAVLALLNVIRRNGIDIVL
jgi:putative transcriptional regulator